MPTKWTTRLRRSAVKNIQFENLLPDERPVFVASWLYAVTVLTVASLILVLGSGGILAFKGASWYHSSEVGHFVNSLHFWSTEFFFLFLIVHLWGNFWRAAWRGRRFATWVTGSVAFFISIVTAFTGYLVQTNFDSQWIASQSKDAINSVGIGSFLNTLNTGQMLLLHVSLLPVVIIAVVVWHVILVQQHGFVPPIDAKEIDRDVK